MSDIIRTKYHELSEELKKIVIGHDEAIRFTVVAILSGGHVLLEGPPGTGKTLLVRALSKALDLRYKRIQFTPDLMPSDITGTNIFNMQSSSFQFQPGPVFTDLLLADEINRAPAKTQAALLEVMQEKQITVDGKPSKVSDVFTVIATQNPIELEGTHPLPEAELDRFMFKLLIDYPGEEEEAKIIATHHKHFQASSLDDFGIKQIFNIGTLVELRKEIENSFLKPEIAMYATQLVRRTREEPTIEWGASSRAALTLFVAAKAWAATEGRDYVIPDDIQAVFMQTLRHRIILKPGSMLEGISPDDVLKGILTSVEVPR